MTTPAWRLIGPTLAVVLGAVSLAGCGLFPTMSDRECMARVMYFESNRSSESGMFAVGTVVMNRVASPKYPKTVCGVVGQPHQFAPGVLRKPMTGKARLRAYKVADAVLAGQRYPGMKGVMYFHTHDTSYPRPNRTYVVIAGGNAFYHRGEGRVPARASSPIAVAARSTTQPTLPVRATKTARVALPPSSHTPSPVAPYSAGALTPLPVPQPVEPRVAQVADHSAVPAVVPLPEPEPARPAAGAPASIDDLLQQNDLGGAGGLY